MKRVNSSVLQFLDTEAQVDESEEEEEDEDSRRDLDESFIDDENNEEVSTQSRIAAVRLPNAEEHALDRLIERILSMSAGRSQRPGYLQTESESGTYAQEVVAYLPRDGDYPLWKLDCRIGTEELAVFSLMATVEERHQLRSAFTRGSVRGSIYVESTMNQDLIDLLKITPGIIRSRFGVHRQMIEQKDYVELLKMKNHRVDIEAGEWVLVKKGLYKGDAALVLATGSWGARLLLVPRIDYTPRIDRKRKASCVKPKAQLFDADIVRQLVSHKIVSRQDGSYTLGLLQFRNGLLEKDFDYHSFAKVVNDIPYSHFVMFKQSRHPDVVLSRLPRPREWIFKENDSIIILSKDEAAIIKSVEVFHAEVERTEPYFSPWDGSARFPDHIPWHDIRKQVNIGQYIRVSGGPDIGRAGWVVEVKFQSVSFVEKMLDGEVVNYNNVMETIEVLINCTEVCEPPHLHQSLSIDANVHQSESLNPLLKKIHRHPWCGHHILISRRHHPRKGETGEIKEVIGQKDGNDIKLHIQLTRYNPSAPFQNVMVDYDDVVESSTMTPLLEFLDPGVDFCRPPPKARSQSEERRRRIGREIANSRYSFESSSTGNRTPMPTPSQVLETPAWDPSSRTPMQLTSDTPQWLGPHWPSGSQTPLSPSPKSPSSQTSISQHVLFNSKLAGAQLNVIANGGEFLKKELTASISVSDDGVVLVRHVKYHTSILLEPEWILPKHPNPTHDNGLLVVIKGDHCGKHVRRLHHRRNGSSTVMVLAVVIRSENSPDSITGEQLELGVEYLCTVTESKKQRDLNRDLMTQARKAYRARRD